MTVSVDECSVIRSVGGSQDRHHGNGEDYTGGKGLGQAMGKGRILVSFLDTPNDHILFCLCVGEQRDVWGSCVTR